MESGQRKRQFNSRTHALQTLEGVDISGKTFAITGTTSGIGIETARALVLKGAHVVMMNRNVAESEKLKAKFLEEKPAALVDTIACDLSSLRSVQSAAREFLAKKWPLHGLILNAGVFGPPMKQTQDGFEAHFGVNHVAHYFLIRELLPVLRESAPSRIVILSSVMSSNTGIKPSSSVEEKLKLLCPAGDNSRLGYKLYASSKMCNTLTAFKLHRDEYSNGVSSYSVHPGSGVQTDLMRETCAGKMMNFVSKPFTKTPSQGAATSVYCATHPEVAETSGKYWESCWDDEKNLDKAVARDEKLQDALWTHTEQLIDTWEKTH